jgi:hypothetical protein
MNFLQGVNKNLYQQMKNPYFKIFFKIIDRNYREKLFYGQS